MNPQATTRQTRSPPTHTPHHTTSQDREDFGHNIAYVTPPGGSNATEETIKPILTNLLAPAGIVVVNVRQLLDSNSRMSLQKWVIEFRAAKTFDLPEVTRIKKVPFDNGNANLHYCQDFCDAHEICKQCLGSKVHVNVRDRDIYCLCRKFKKDIGTPEARQTSKKAKSSAFASRMARANGPRPSTSQTTPAAAPRATPALPDSVAAAAARMNTTN
jgi:hypothetical protein